MTAFLEQLSALESEGAGESGYAIVLQRFRPDHPEAEDHVRGLIRPYCE